MKKNAMNKVNHMEMALLEAKKAEKKGEVPIGAVIVLNGQILATAHNQREKKQNALYHAEILAINKACKKTKSWRLDGAVMYVTLMPCPMCAGAIVNSRIAEVIYAASDEKNSLFTEILKNNNLNHKTKFKEDKNKKLAASELLSNFFKQTRNLK